MSEDYDPKTHKWEVGDWFMVVAPDKSDEAFIASYGNGPHKVIAFSSDVVAAKWGPARYWFLPSQIRPCAPPTEEANQ